MLDSEIIEKMEIIYKSYVNDWMGWEVTGRNCLTIHHLEEKRRKKGKKLEIEYPNRALLTKEAHIILHDLERFYPELYEEYNYMFRIINEMQCPLTFEIINIMGALRERAEAALNTESELVKSYIP